MWQLSLNQNNKRTYTNPATNSRCEQELIKVDKEGNNWWAFTDLMTMPFTRNFAAQKITALYQLGLTKDDLDKHITELKKILNSDDKEKYQKAYANVLDFETKTEAATNPVRQMSSLVCVYYTLNDEPIDSFDGTTQAKKMSILESDPELHSFFLQHQMNLIEGFTGFLSNLSKTSLAPTVELPEVSP